MENPGTFVLKRLYLFPELVTSNVAAPFAWRRRRQKRFQCCLDPNLIEETILYIRAIQGHSGGTKVDPTLQDNVMIPNDFVEYIYHVVVLTTCTPSSNQG